MKLSQNFVIPVLSGVLAAFVAHTMSVWMPWDDWKWLFIATPGVLSILFWACSRMFGAWEEGKGFSLLFLGGAIGSAFGLFIVPLFMA